MARAMPMLAVLSLLAAAVSLAAAARDNAAVSDNRKVDFDYFYLVRQWPATYCNDHYCTHRPPQKYAFTVHGLWPERQDGTWPEFCDSGSRLNLDDIEDLLPDLEKAWPSWSSDNEAFWNHEWARHGTCAEGVLGMQHSFFKTVLELHTKLNIQDAFSKQDIVPSNYAKYHIEALKHAIGDMHGVMPRITCDQAGQLAEVWMCIDKKLRVIDCVEEPHPHSSARRLSDNVPSNFNCNLVKIPTLERKTEGTEQEDASKSSSNAGQGAQERLLVVQV